MRHALRWRANLVLTLGALGLLAAVTVVPSLVTTQDPFEQDLLARLKPPTRDRLFGTDKFGRDLLARTVYGARISLGVGAGAVLLAGTFGVSLGLVAGYYGGTAEFTLMRLTDAQAAFPAVILAIVAVAALGSSLLVLVGVLAVIGWVDYARIVYNTTRSLKQREFVLSARAVGAGDARIILRYILGNTWTPVVVVAAFQVAQMILTEAGLSFLGLGLQPPTPSWGSMLNESKDVMTVAPWLGLFPGLAITLTILTVNLGAEAIRGALTPQAAGRFDGLSD